MKVSSPPAHLDKGSDLFERIRNACEKFTPSFRKVAEYIISHTQEVAFSPAARVAAAAGVSESVVVRFAGELGYSGYPAMQEATQAVVRSQLQGPSARFEALPITSASTSLDIFRSVVLQDAGNLHATIDHLPNSTAFAEIVDVLLEAQHVYVMGFRGLSYLAGLTAFLLDMAGLETTLITQGDAVGFQMASRIRKGDALLAFAFVRYTKVTRELVEMARGRGATTIVICNSVMAPAARVADHVLQTATGSSGFHNSYVAATACVNALVTAMSTKARSRVGRRLREVDEVLPADYFDMS